MTATYAWNLSTESPTLTTIFSSQHLNGTGKEGECCSADCSYNRQGDCDSLYEVMTLIVT